MRSNTLDSLSEIGGGVASYFSNVRDDSGLFSLSSSSATSLSSLSNGSLSNTKPYPSMPSLALAAVSAVVNSNAINKRRNKNLMIRSQSLAPTSLVTPIECSKTFSTEREPYCDRNQPKSAKYSCKLEIKFIW